MSSATEVLEQAGSFSNRAGVQATWLSTAGGIKSVPSKSQMHYAVYPDQMLTRPQAAYAASLRSFGLGQNNEPAVISSQMRAAAYAVLAQE